MPWPKAQTSISSRLQRKRYTRTMNRQIGKKWRRMAELYKRFASDYKSADFSDDAAMAMYLHESTGAPLPDARTNGYALGKKWMDVTVAGWKEEIPAGGLLVAELQKDGYPDWFLSRVGVLRLAPTIKGCAWWAAPELIARAQCANM